MDGLNTTQRNLQQLIHNALKDAASLMVVTQDGVAQAATAPIELGVEAMAFRSEKGTVVVPYSAIQRLVVG